MTLCRCEGAHLNVKCVFSSVHYDPFSWFNEYVIPSGNNKLVDIYQKQRA